MEKILPKIKRYFVDTFELEKLPFEQAIQNIRTLDPSTRLDIRYSSGRSGDLITEYLCKISPEVTANYLEKKLEWDCEKDYLPPYAIDKRKISRQKTLFRIYGSRKKFPSRNGFTLSPKRYALVQYSPK